MKLLILSDSHGNVGAMVEAARREQPQAMVHLGDYWRDGQQLRRLLPGIPLYQVAGNCDLFSASGDQVPCITCRIEDVVFFMVHGHQHGVKMGLLRLSLAAREAGARVALFGHTHQSYCQEHDGVLLVNPGSCGYSFGTYAVMELQGESIQCEIRSLRPEK